MTAYNIQIHSPMQQSLKGAAKVGQSFRRLPMVRQHIECMESQVDESSNFWQDGKSDCSSVLRNLRNTYASRGKSLRSVRHGRPATLTAEGDCRMNKTPVKIPALAKDEKSQKDETTGKFSGMFCESVKRRAAAIDSKVTSCGSLWTGANGRQTVSPLKLCLPKTNGKTEDDDESTADESSVDSSDSVGESVASQAGLRTSVKRTYKIRFNYYVKVKEIPHRHTYTGKQRGRLWNSSKEIRGMAKRNRIEYYWEGPDWRNAVEEDQFCEINGDRIHPAHLAR